MIKKFLLWLLNKLGANLIDVPSFKIPEGEVVDLMRQWTGVLADGEYKFHAVFARLVKKHPEVRKSDIKLQIEMMYQKYFK